MIITDAAATPREESHNWTYAASVPFVTNAIAVALVFLLRSPAIISALVVLMAAFGIYLAKGAFRYRHEALSGTLYFKVRNQWATAFFAGCLPFLFTREPTLLHYASTMLLLLVVILLGAPVGPVAAEDVRVMQARDVNQGEK